MTKMNHKIREQTHASRPVVAKGKLSLFNREKRYSKCGKVKQKQKSNLIVSIPRFKPFVNVNQSFPHICKEVIFVPRKGTKMSDYCKNPACTKMSKKRRRKQSGLQGYCFKCAPKFISRDVLLARKRKNKYFFQRRKEKFPCDFCDATYYFKVDLNNGKHYCKVCWSKRKELLIKCNFCCAWNEDVKTKPCKYKEGCTHRTVMCSACFNIYNCGVCVSCWISEFHRSCFKCGDSIVHSPHVRRRFCVSCGAQDDKKQFAKDSNPVCFFCKDPHKPFLQQVKCQQALHCQRCVHVCFMCSNVRDKVPCSVCYLQSHESSDDRIKEFPKCFSCGLMFVQKDKSKWGYYCKECFHFHNEKLGMKLWYKNIFGSFPK